MSEITRTYTEDDIRTGIGKIVAGMAEAMQAVGDNYTLVAQSLRYKGIDVPEHIRAQVRDASELARSTITAATGFVEAFNDYRDAREHFARFVKLESAWRDSLCRLYESLKFLRSFL